MCIYNTHELCTVRRAREGRALTFYSGPAVFIVNLRRRVICYDTRVWLRDFARFSLRTLFCVLSPYGIYCGLVTVMAAHVQAVAILWFGDFMVMAFVQGFLGIWFGEDVWAVFVRCGSWIFVLS